MSHLSTQFWVGADLNPKQHTHISTSLLKLYPQQVWPWLLEGGRKPNPLVACLAQKGPHKPQICVMLSSTPTGVGCPPHALGIPVKGGTPRHCGSNVISVPVCKNPKGTPSGCGSKIGAQNGLPWSMET